MNQNIAHDSKHHDTGPSPVKRIKINDPGWSLSYFGGGGPFDAGARDGS